MQHREVGELHESATLVEEINGQRRSTLQVLLLQLRDGRWQVVVKERAREGGREAVGRFATEGEARDAVEDVYAGMSAAGAWYVSRFGREPYRKPTTDGKPRW